MKANGTMVVLTLQWKNIIAPFLVDFFDEVKQWLDAR